MKTIFYRRKEVPFTLSTLIMFEQSRMTAARVELKALDGTIIGGVYMYSDEDHVESIPLEDIYQGRVS